MSIVWGTRELEAWCQWTMNPSVMFQVLTGTCLTQLYLLLSSLLPDHNQYTLYTHFMSVCRGTRHVNISLKLTWDWFFYAKYLHIHEGCCKNLILLYITFILKILCIWKISSLCFSCFSEIRLLFSQSLSTKLGFKASCSLRDCLKLPFVKLLTELWTISLYTVIWQS